ncbi:MAG: 16S rRNA (uracil(1498)-N(3))-methyltransferase [Desulfobacterota bacterium]|nr:16S rRNA (uracil(1498)-N(3))-methyltransferase [Thermodesulfobacteriota bacterium]MDW8002406.1 RsmE family RNA methyltransferase [Deltaproteobacteria bacterium]
MEVRRIFVDKVKAKNGLIFVTGPMYRYVVNVLRKAPGDRIDLIDGKGYLYRAHIHSVKKKEVYFKILDVVYHPEEKKRKVTLCVSPIKGPRMDWMIEKATELGVDRILPTLFKRTIIKLDEKDKKVERWKRLAVEASRQSGRFTVPEILNPVPLRGILPYVKDADVRWVLYEHERERQLRDVFGETGDGQICIAIGPEGGIEESEISWLKENGFIPVSLGNTIFRTETTPLVVLSIIHYESIKK